MLKLEEVYRRTKRINGLRGGKPMSKHYGMNAKIVSCFGVRKVYEEPIELTIIRATLEFETSFRKGFNPNKRHTFGK